MISKIPVDVAAFGAVLAAQAEPTPVKVWDNGATTGAQKTDDSGVPMWRVGVLVQVPGGVEKLEVKFPSAAAPRFDVMGKVAVRGLTATVVRDGAVYFSASAVVPASADAGNRRPQ